MLRKEVIRIYYYYYYYFGKGHGFHAVKGGGGDFHVKLSFAIVKDIYVARGEDQWRELKKETLYREVMVRKPKR